MRPIYLIALFLFALLSIAAATQIESSEVEMIELSEQAADFEEAALEELEAKPHLQKATPPAPKPKASNSKPTPSMKPFMSKYANKKPLGGLSSFLRPPTVTPRPWSNKAAPTPAKKLTLGEKLAQLKNKQQKPVTPKATAKPNTQSLKDKLKKH